VSKTAFKKPPQKKRGLGGVPAKKGKGYLYCRKKGLSKALPLKGLGTQ